MCKYLNLKVNFRVSGVLVGSSLWQNVELDTAQNIRCPLVSALYGVLVAGVTD